MEERDKDKDLDLDKAKQAVEQLGELMNKLGLTRIEIEGSRIVLAREALPGPPSIHQNSNP